MSVSQSSSTLQSLTSPSAQSVPSGTSIECTPFYMISNSGITYHVQCGVAYTGTTLTLTDLNKRATINFLAGCEDVCDTTEECVAVSYRSSTKACSLYSQTSGLVIVSDSMAGLKVEFEATSSSSLVSPAAAAPSSSGTSCSSILILN